ncbi:DNA-binding response regulator, OmpR family, contains REC and winged-helix (wHTH) domain [Nakamurella panacisegetis]|uniref:DNA-binding response regulator, OmpR family, contains REC and winged-helix (WHTH) domain n=1 Tax=Nakamurella panacisegetis TaxID=1090615 RepID=A0A1H0NSV2_9ACTN|nr:response regulator transcription factor [Nakamurella panacisegetis]SDO95734.1 DNA-binding response regulator, OmpR family, contains REC and winged-helix (wHTH) domain [Nakamurella panacisegetis]
MEHTTTAGPARGLVLVVEDESTIADVIRRYLVAAGFTVQTTGSGRSAQAIIRRDRPVAVVMDIGLPDLDGLSVCQQLRAAGDWTPVIFVTARDEDVDRILGLELGGDDYLVKPFNPRELVARVRTVLRRSGAAVGASPVLVAGRLRADTAQRRVWADSGEIALTATEFDLLVYLMRHPERVFDRQSLLSSVWGYAAASGLRTVDVHIAALRAKLGDASPIRTVRGVGYAVEGG